MGPNFNLIIYSQDPVNLNEFVKFLLGEFEFALGCATEIMSLNFEDSSFVTHPWSSEYLIELENVHERSARGIFIYFGEAGVRSHHSCISFDIPRGNIKSFTVSITSESLPSFKDDAIRAISSRVNEKIRANNGVSVLFFGEELSREEKISSWLDVANAILTGSRPDWVILDFVVFDNLRGALGSLRYQEIHSDGRVLLAPPNAE